MLAMNLKHKIDQRQQANAEILQIIGEAVMKYPDLRFGQILAMLDIIQYKIVNKIGALGSHMIETVDPFHEESVDILTRIRNKIQNLNKKYERNRKLNMEDNLKAYIWQDFRKNNIPKYYKYFEEWYSNLTDNQKYYWTLRMSGKIC